MTPFPVPPIPRCPWCGGTFTIDEQAEKSVVMAPSYFVVERDQLREQTVPCIVAFCNGCEFCVEIGHFVSNERRDGGVDA